MVLSYFFIWDIFFCFPILFDSLWLCVCVFIMENSPPVLFPCLGGVALCRRWALLFIRATVLVVSQTISPLISAPWGPESYSCYWPKHGAQVCPLCVPVGFDRVLCVAWGRSNLFTRWFWWHGGGRMPSVCIYQCQVQVVWAGGRGCLLTTGIKSEWEGKDGLHQPQCQQCWGSPY